MRIITRNRRKYNYSPITNKIRLWEGGVDLCEDLSPVSYSETFDYSFDKISMFTIEITQQCNLRCKYCIYSGSYNNRRSHNNTTFPIEAITPLIDFIASHADKTTPVITICFYGGEALLQKEKIKTIIDGLDSLDFSFEYTISTNGVLLSKETIDWICSVSKLKVTITIDGDVATHDANRVFPNGDGSYNIVMTNLKWFKDQYPQEYDKRIQFLATVDSISSLHDLSIFWEQNPILTSHRPVHISSILPNFSKENDASDPILLLKKQLTIYNEALASYLKGEENILTDELKRLVRIIEHREFFELPKQQRFFSCCHNPYSCFITSTGLLYVCEKFNSDYSVGNIYGGFDKAAFRKINAVFTERKNTHCSKCWAKRLCRICATNVNHSMSEFEFFCNRERQKIQLALKYYCEIQEYKHIHKNI